MNIGVVINHLFIIQFSSVQFVELNNKQMIDNDASIH